MVFVLCIIKIQFFKHSFLPNKKEPICISTKSALFSAFYYVILMFFVKLSKQLLTLKIIFLNMVLKVNVVGALHLKAVHGFSCLGYVKLVVVII